MTANQNLVELLFENDELELASHPKHKFGHQVRTDRFKRESTVKKVRIEKALKTDKSTWKKCKYCGELFPETNDFWIKNGKKTDGSQKYRTSCGDNGNGCYQKYAHKPRKDGLKRNHQEKMANWKGHLQERKSAAHDSDNVRIERKVRAGIKLTEFEQLLRNNVIKEVHPLTIEVLVDMLKKQKYKCAETGFEFILEYPHLNNLSVDRMPGHEYHTPEGSQLVVQWYNKAVGASSREQRDMLNEQLKTHWKDLTNPNNML